MPYVYEVVAWIAEGKLAVMKLCTPTKDYCRAMELASEIRLAYNKATSEGGFVTIEDISDGRILDVREFEKAAKAAASV